MSEDLDFSVGTELGSMRGDRRKAIEPVKQQFAGMQKAIPALTLAGDMAGHNEGRQYTATITYQSVFALGGTVKFEVGLCEPAIDKAHDAQAGTLMIDKVSVTCLTARGAFFEKIRGALTRKDPAIRDLFDIDYAVHHQCIDLTDPTLMWYEKRKIAIPDNGAIDI